MAKGCREDLRCSLNHPLRSVAAEVYCGSQKLGKRRRGHEIQSLRSVTPISPEQASGQELPIDLLYEILIHLPVHTLIRFKSVSKQWYSLISNPLFHKTHYLRRRSPPLLFVVKTEHDLRGIPTLHFATYTNQLTLLTTFSKPIPGSTGEEYLKWPFVAVGSGLGLVCIASWWGGPILLCNPATQELISLPLSRGLPQCVALAACADSVKVVRFFYGLHDENCCEVFTLGTDHGWRKAAPPPFTPCWNAPLLHGAFHLFPSGESKRPIAAAFSLDSQQYRSIPLPDVHFGVAADRFLAESRGSLYILFDYFLTKRNLELWVLKDYAGGKWAKEYVIDFSFSLNFIAPTPVATVADASLLFNVYNKEAQAFNLCCYSTREHCFTDKMIQGYSATSYVESLRPLGNETSYTPKLGSCKHITYNLSSCTNKKLRLLKQRLESELEQTRHFSRLLG